jgi:CRP/FNR family transcriptional regulator
MMERETLAEVINSKPGLGLWLTRLMSERQARMEDRLESLLFKSANGKVAQILLKLARDHGESIGEGTLINYPITHQEIGNLIATTRETVSYAFMEFRRLGLISTRRRRTIVHDLDELGLVALT